MNKIDHEEFENYLEGDSDLSRAYAKLSKEEPSSDLDSVILEQARRDINNESNIPGNVTKIKKSLFSSRLDSPLAMAAVIVLCVSLVLLVPQDEILLEPTSEIIPESLPVMTDESDQAIHQQADKIMSKTRPAAAIETSKPDVMGRAREESFSEKKELLKETPKEEALINESRVKERSMPEPASAPEYRSDMKQKARQDQMEDAAEISSGIAPMEAVEMETGVAKRQLMKDSITSDKASPEVLSKQIKSLIQQDKIEEARSVYQQFVELFPDQPLYKWFTDQDISLLDR